MRPDVRSNRTTDVRIVNIRRTELLQRIKIQACPLPARAITSDTIHLKAAALCLCIEIMAVGSCPHSYHYFGAMQWIEC